MQHDDVLHGTAPSAPEDAALGSGDASPVVLLEAALWTRLTEADTREDVAAAWLVLQCRMLRGASAGLLLLVGNDGATRTAARWPEDGAGDAVLRNAALTAVTGRRGAVTSGSGAGRCIAYPVLVDDTVHGAVSVLVTGGSDVETRSAMRQVQWGVAWLRDWIRREGAGDAERARANSKLALEFFATVLEAERFQQAAVAVVTELALLSRSDRVSLGFRRRGSTAIKAISHTARFGRKMDLVRALGGAMDEAIDQHSTIHLAGFGPDAELDPDADLDADQILATRANRDLARMLGGANVLTIPVLVQDRFALAFTLERGPQDAFRQEEIDLITTVAAAVGPVLEEKRQNDRWIGFKVLESLGNGVVRLLGPGNLAAKLAVLASLAAIAFFGLATAEYSVSASAQVEGLTRRSIVAPSDGFIKEAHARAGDTVRSGTLLAALEDRDLVLERMRWQTERQQRELEYQTALAARERAKLNIIKSQIDQADAQLALVEELLARTRFVAPFDALVVAGDLSQSISAAVSRGQVLFDLAPLEGYRVNIHVDESQIADIELGQTGQVLVSSLPDRPFAFTIEKITSVSEQREGRNVFKVEGLLTETSPALRPGMDGVAKIDIERRHLIWIWTRSMIDWARVQLWRWLP